MAIVRFKTAYYGSDRHGHPVAMLCNEWRETKGGRSGSAPERFIECDTIEQARAVAIGLCRNVRALNS